METASYLPLTVFVIILLGGTFYLLLSYRRPPRVMLALNATGARRVFGLFTIVFACQLFVSFIVLSRNPIELLLAVAGVGLALHLLVSPGLTEMSEGERRKALRRSIIASLAVVAWAIISLVVLVNAPEDVSYAAHLIAVSLILVWVASSFIKVRVG